MRGFRGGVHTMMGSLVGGVLKALSLNMAPINLPEMRFSRQIRRYGPASNRTTTDFSNRQHGQRECDRRRRQIASGSP
jgi:hypothetical protein